MSELPASDSGSDNGASDLRDRIAVVTGASSGIGRATAILLARRGADVALVGRDRETLGDTARVVRERGRRAAVIRADVTERDSGNAIVEAVIGELGGLDILVNSAGIIGSGTVEDTTDEDWDAMMRVNVDAVFRLMRAAVPPLRARPGCVVNVSSVTGLRAFPGVLAYCVSKAAADQLTRCAALDLASAGIRVNAVNPGVVISGLHRRAGMAEDAYRDFLDHSRTTHPLGRVGEPDEIARAIVFLASDASGWITGETLSVDGGRHLTCAR